MKAAIKMPKGAKIKPLNRIVTKYTAECKGIDLMLKKLKTISQLQKEINGTKLKVNFTHSINK